MKESTVVGPTPEMGFTNGEKKRCQLPFYETEVRDMEGNSWLGKHSPMVTLLKELKEGRNTQNWDGTRN